MRVATVGQAVVVALAGSLALGVGLLFSCSPTPGTPAASTAGQQCTRPGTPVWLGASSRDVSPGRFTVTAGTYRVSGRDFVPPAPVPILRTGITAVILGPGSSTPIYNRQRATVAHASLSFRVEKEAPVVLHLDASSYWVLNSLGVSLDLTPCDGGRISRVSFPTGRLTPTLPASSTASR